MDARREMPDVPKPMALVGCKPTGPMKSGIYFIWDGDEVAYVGQSVQIGKRVTFGQHHGKIKDGDAFSWLLFERKELMFAECFYIWLCRPKRNSDTPGVTTKSRFLTGLRQEAIAVLLAGGMTVSDAAKRLNIGRRTVHRWLASDQNFTELIRSMRHRITTSSIDDKNANVRAAS